MRWFLSFFVVIVLVTCVSAASHSQFPVFSAPEDFSVENNVVSVTDDAVYNTGWYSINGNDWQLFSLQGNPYGNSQDWLAGSATASVPSFGVGEHYVIVYGCSYDADWDCHGTWQLQVINNSEVVIEEADYYVAPNGNDNNPGTIELPFGTWSKAFNTAQPGDVVYFRGGTYISEVTDGTGIRYIPAQGLGHDGTAANPIRYFAYPGETPVLDTSNSFLTGEQATYTHALYFEGVDYVHVKGLHIQNLFQRETADPEGDYDVVIAFEIRYANNTVIENCVVHDVGGEAFRSQLGYQVDFINCDAYNCVDYYHKTTPGSYGTGFHASGVHALGGGIVTFTGCRAWNCSDQGFGSAWAGTTIFEDCWSFENGLSNGSGNGFKSSANSVPDPSLTIVEYNNCISAGNGKNPHFSGDGFTTNDNSGNGYKISYNNCLSYNDDRFGFISYITTLPGDRTWKNNIAYAAGNENSRLYGEVNVHTNNSWDSPMTVDDNDFVSLDVNQLYRPRKADGSLPDITFGKLVEGSNLIDAGTDVGLPFSGVAPDVGAFESNYNIIDCDCPENEYCFEDVCLKEVSGKTYFVTTNGNDNNLGTFEQPWGTWKKAFDTADAGDIVYFREGEWYPTESVSYDTRFAGNNGTESNHIIYENYPGETPVLDLDRYDYTRSMSGLAIHHVTNIEFRGLTVRNNKQDVYDQWISGLEFYECGNLWVDRVTSHGHGGYGIWFVGYDNLYLTNSDSYDNIDFIADTPGNRADGFQVSVGGRNDTYTYISGCRSWNNSDDGFEISSLGELEVSNCWAFGNGRLEFGAGSSFKYGYGYEQDPGKRRTHNNIAAFNKGSGFVDQNLRMEFIGPVGEFSNNIAYRCKMGFTSSPGTFNCTTGYADVVFNNNLVYQSTYGVVDDNYPSYYDQAYLAACNYGYPVYSSYSHNTWIPKATGPYSEYNPAVTVTDDDFVLLPEDVEDCTAIMSAPRKADGSLPDIGAYFQLAEGSDLIDAGVDVGFPYEGAAPDIGAYEFQG